MNNDVLETFSQKQCNEKYDVIMNKYKMDMKHIIRTAIVGFPILIAYDIIRIYLDVKSYCSIGRNSLIWYFPVVIFTGYVIRKVQIAKHRKKKALEELDQKKSLYISMGKFEF